MEDKFLHDLFSRNTTIFSNFPDKKKSIFFVENVFGFLFSAAGTGNEYTVFINSYKQLKIEFSEVLFTFLKDEQTVVDHVETFFRSLPVIYNKLLADAEAFLEFDPAAQTLEEVLIAYPGFYAIAIYRLAHQMHHQGIPILPRLTCEHAHSKTGIDIHPAAKIGQSFFIDHGTGVVIGETSVIGNEVKIYQGVTLGALTVSKANAKQKRHPTIEDKVIIYSGATILGGDTIIGHSSIIGGNTWLTHSVAPFSIVYHDSKVIIRDKNPLPDVLNFVI